jgi:GT2 family glycosyltransferase
MVEHDFPWAELSIDASNPGYGAGANRGIRRCGIADVLLLNSDTCLAPGGLRALTGYLASHPRAGIVGPRLIHEDGTLQPSAFRFPSAIYPPVQRSPFVSVIRRVPWARERYLPTWSHSSARRVPYVMGAALLIRRAAFDAVGGFDESFFMYAEEIDLSWRLQAAGWETHFAPVTTVMHAGCASTRQMRTAMLERSAVSSMRFYRTRYSGAALRLGLLSIRAAMAGRLARDWVRCRCTRNVERQRELAANVDVWRRVLARREIATAP